MPVFKHPDIALYQLDDVIVLLLCAGDKKTQSKDIKLAKEYLKDYLEGESYG